MQAPQMIPTRKALLKKMMMSLHPHRFACTTTYENALQTSFFLIHQDALDKIDESCDEQQQEHIISDEDLLGHRVFKDFQGYGLFEGIITHVEVVDDGSDVNLFQVEYEDGDAEDLERHELDDILVSPLPADEELVACRKIRAKIRDAKATKQQVS